MLDFFAGELGWSSAFAARGHECICVDLKIPRRTVPAGCQIIVGDILGWQPRHIRQLGVDFICASSPCEGFSVFGMKNFHPEPEYPEMGIRLFNHTASICQESGVPYVMENVRSAQEFVGRAVNHAGSFYLWGNAVPPLLHRGLVKGFTRAGGRYRAHENRSITPAEAATIPPELANCVADYAERICEASTTEAK